VIGTCHAYAYASADRNELFYHYVDESYDSDGKLHTTEWTEYTPYSPSATANAYGEWYDSISFLFSDPSLNSDPTASIQFRMSVVLDAETVGCESLSLSEPVSESSAGASLNVLDENLRYLAGVDTGRTGCGEVQNDYSQYTMSVSPGAAITLLGAVGAQAKVDLYPRTLPNSALAYADASSTAHYYIDVLTEGAYYTDEAGGINTLSSPQPSPNAVPEPSALVLLLAGVVALTLSGRHGRSREGRTD
jgi:hypothetical protein